MVNYQKLPIFFKVNMDRENHMVLQNSLSISSTSGFNKYLDLLVLINWTKIQRFNFINERMRKKISSWIEKQLSLTGKEVLFKIVTSATPNYVMQYFMLPLSFCEEIEKNIKQFWWGSTKRKIHQISWKRFTQSRLDGGLGFKYLHLFNLPIVAKQCQRIIFEAK